MRELKRCFETIARKYAVHLLSAYPNLKQYIDVSGNVQTSKEFDTGNDDKQQDNPAEVVTLIPTNVQLEKSKQGLQELEGQKDSQIQSNSKSINENT